LQQPQPLQTDKRNQHVTILILDCLAWVILVRCLHLLLLRMVDGRSLALKD
jgi:hypothetical protein